MYAPIYKMYVDHVGSFFFINLATRYDHASCLTKKNQCIHFRPQVKGDPLFKHLLAFVKFCYAMSCQIDDGILRFV